MMLSQRETQCVTFLWQRSDSVQTATLNQITRKCPEGIRVYGALKQMLGS